DTKWLEEKSRLAMPLCLAILGTEEPVLPHLEEIEVSIVSDEAIAQVHDEFMDDPTATDVITFHHGEILISADTARREGPAHGHSFEKEMMLYLVHGLLHLNGHTDLSEREREEMHQCQNRILNEIVLGDSTN
ncbi:MAG: rRNA maturation RNase YbeY, partial [Verrucomicrobiota bacterium]